MKGQWPAMCMIDGADGWEASTVMHPKARKEYDCYECRRLIPLGERYQKIKGLQDGKWDTYRTCAHCEVASSWLVEICGGYLTGGVLEDLEDHWDQEPDLCHLWLGRTILNMRRRWRDKAGELVPVPTLILPPKYLATKAA